MSKFATPEAKVEALTEILKTHLYPMLSLFEIVLWVEKCVALAFEDNQGAQAILSTGRLEKTMGCVGRTCELDIIFTSDQKKTEGVPPEGIAIQPSRCKNRTLSNNKVNIAGELLSHMYFRCSSALTKWTRPQTNPL